MLSEIVKIVENKEDIKNPRMYTHNRVYVPESDESIILLITLTGITMEHDASNQDQRYTSAVKRL